MSAGGTRFVDRYGGWALVAGASEGLGAAFARELAARGLNLVLVARRLGPLEALAAELAGRHTSIKVVTIVADLATEAGIGATLFGAAGVEVGLVVANAAYAPVGLFIGSSLDESHRAVELNCLAPVRLAHHFLPSMVERRRGGFIVMSSLAGMQGSPPISVYAATKAFGAVFAEGLWSETKDRGVDVLACVAGAVATPGLAGAKRRAAPGTLEPAEVVAAAIRKLGHGPRTVPGATMRISAQLMSRVLPRRAAIALIRRASNDLTASD
jgi:short-subunit dehydrogenase